MPPDEIVFDGLAAQGRIAAVYRRIREREQANNAPEAPMHENPNQVLRRLHYHFHPENRYPIPNAVPAGQPAIPQMNGAQNTHTASIHRTVSESAIRLFIRYGEQIKAPLLQQHLMEIIAFGNSLDKDNRIHSAAKRALSRLTNKYQFSDPTSKVNLQQLLALSWLAIHDKNLRTGTLEDAKNQFVIGLYESQRGLNLSGKGVDNLNKIDRFICPAGTFNKILEKLNALHPDVEILMITSEVAAFKLPIVVKEEAHRFLRSRAYPQNSTELLDFTRRVKQIEIEGVANIWELIKNKVKERMFDEFGSLYENDKDPKFIQFIETGLSVDLGCLPTFQKELAESRGYRLYNRSLLRSSYFVFFESHFEEKIETTSAVIKNN